MLQVIKAVFAKPLTRVKSCQRPFLICVKCGTPLTRIKAIAKLLSNVRQLTKVPLMTFASRQRTVTFDAHESCVKDNDKC